MRRDSDEYKAESKKVTRCFQPYSTDERAAHAASHRLGHRQKEARGHHFYVHSDMPNLGFPTRDRAVRAGLARLAKQDETPTVEAMRAALNATTERAPGAREE